MSPASYSKLRRDQARARGDCLQCCKRKAMRGRSRCQRCYDLHLNRQPLDAEAHKERRKRARATGMCGSCVIRQAEHGKRYCLECGNGERRRDAPVGQWCEDCIAVGFHRQGCGA